MKNNLIENEFEEFEERNVPIKIPLNSNSNNIQRNNNNFDNYQRQEVNQMDYSDELNKSNNILF